MKRSCFLFSKPIIKTYSYKYPKNREYYRNYKNHILVFTYLLNKDSGIQILK